MPEAEPKLPTLSQALIFGAKVRVLRVQRAVQNTLNPVRKLERTGEAAACLVASSSTPLWTETHPDEQRLQLGKVHNLRLVCRAINGLNLNPGDVFSFWRQVGNPSKLRGYVPGRQIQERCIIPAILAERMLEGGVALVPGSAFGAPGCLRLSFATSMEQLDAALTRMAKVIGTNS
jgi:hypothetical protein